MHCFPVQRTRSSFCLQRRKPHIQSLIIEVALLEDAGSTFAQVCFYFLLLLCFSVGVRGVVQIYIGTALAITEVILPINIHLNLKKCNDTCIVVFCQGGGVLHQISVWYSFSMTLTCQRLNSHGFVLMGWGGGGSLNVFCPLHFYI